MKFLELTLWHPFEILKRDLQKAQEEKKSGNDSRGKAIGEDILDEAKEMKGEDKKEDKEEKMTEEKKEEKENEKELENETDELILDDSQIKELRINYGLIRRALTKCSM